MPGPQELIIILIIVLLLFGGSRLAGLGKSTGRAIKEFKEETKGIKGGETPPAETGTTETTGQTPYQTEAGSTFVQSPQAGSPYVAPPQGGTPYQQPTQQDEIRYDGQPQNGQPQNAQPQNGQAANGSPYGQPPQGYQTERDARRDV